MIEKASITVPESLLKEMDQVIDYPDDRSTVIEQAIREYLERQKRNSKEAVGQRDLALINNFADQLNEEAEDVLSYH